MELCPESLWENLCGEDATCTFYQTPAWHRIAARHFQAKSVPLLFQFKDTSACLPLLKDRRWGRDRYFSPFGTYTALVCPRTLVKEDLDFVIRTLRKLNIHLTSSPFTPNTITVGEPLVSKTQVIDLNLVDLENPMKNWEPDHRRRALLAQRNGVTVRAAESEKDWERYLDLYRMTVQRWGKKATQAYPKALFENLRKELDGTSAMRLWLAEHDGKIGAGYVTFYHNRHVANWHGAADKSFFKLGATQALMLAMIPDACRRGLTVFDLGGSGGLSSLEFFKRQFGSQTLEFTSSLNRLGLLGLLSKVRATLGVGLKMNGLKKSE